MQRFVLTRRSLSGFCIALALSALSVAQSSGTSGSSAQGDVDGDGAITIDDGQAILAAVAAGQPKALGGVADYDMNGAIDVDDATAIFDRFIQSAESGTSSAVDVRTQVLSSDFIFEGRVVDIQHRESTVMQSGDLALPHTFVTYNIHEVYKGKAPKKRAPGGQRTITLRFLGGMATDGRFFFVSGLPHFEVGSVDVVMLRGNGESIQPLTQGPLPLLHISKDSITTEAGLGVRALSMHGVRLVKPPKQIREGAPQRRVLTSDLYRSVLRRLVARLHDPSDVHAAPVVSVDPNLPFRLPAPE